MLYSQSILISGVANGSTSMSLRFFVCLNDNKKKKKKNPFILSNLNLYQMCFFLFFFFHPPKWVGTHERPQPWGVTRGEKPLHGERNLFTEREPEGKILGQLSEKPHFIGIWICWRTFDSRINLQIFFWKTPHYNIVKIFDKLFWKVHRDLNNVIWFYVSDNILKM